jgi:hypothetical protein
MATSAPATIRQALIHKAKKQLEEGSGGMTDDSIQAWALMDIAESLMEIKNLLIVIANKRV